MEFGRINKTDREAFLAEALVGEYDSRFPARGVVNASWIAKNELAKNSAST